MSAPQGRPLAGAIVVTALALAGALAPGRAAAQTTYIAFGDSITAGYHDDPARARPGYPPRLEALLQQRGKSAVVVNAGLNGETTAEGVTRLSSVLASQPGNTLLLMEGTNDINEKVSIETTIFNLDRMAKKAEAVGMTVVHASVIPRLPSANYDGDNQVTGRFAISVRDLAATAGRQLADPFEVFFYYTPDVFANDYFGGDDKLHPNAAGYDVLARIFADVVTGVDSVPPVPGAFSPANGATQVGALTPIQLVLYDFGQGLDLQATKLVVNGAEVDTAIAGGGRKAQLLYTPTAPLVGVVTFAVHSRDLATPPNVLTRDLARFVIAGTRFLAGDINRDGRVDGLDLVALALVFGTRLGDPRFSPAADLSGDGTIDGRDLAILAANFGQSSF